MPVNDLCDDRGLDRCGVVVILPLPSDGAHFFAKRFQDHKLASEQTQHKLFQRHKCTCRNQVLAPAVNSNANKQS